MAAALRAGDCHGIGPRVVWRKEQLLLSANLARKFVSRQHYSDGPGVADLSVRFDRHQANSGRHSIWQSKSDLRKTEAGDQAHIFGRNIKALVVSVDQINRYRRRRLSLIKLQIPRE